MLGLVYDPKKIFSIMAVLLMKKIFFESLKIRFIVTPCRKISVFVFCTCWQKHEVLDNLETRNEVYMLHGKLSLVKYHEKVK